MSTLSQWLIFVGIASQLAPLAGCSSALPGPGEEPVLQDETAVSESPGRERIITNGLDASILSSERDALLDLSDAPLSASSLGESPLFATAPGRKLLGYVVMCSMGWDDNFNVFKADREYILEGGIGLAPSWKDAALTVSERRWLSACLLAHANAFGVEVPLSLRGPHPALSTTAGELSDYPVQEGAFYGDILERSAPPLAFACAGTAQNDGCQREMNEWLKERACARESASTLDCGMEWAGNCYALSIGGESPPACNTLSGDAYPECHSAPAAAGPDPGAVFSEVITVYLKPAADGRCD